MYTQQHRELSSSSSPARSRAYLGEDWLRQERIPRLPPGMSTSSYTHKTSEYTYRVPTPPRIVVPPPALNADAVPQITLNALRSANFLNSVNYNNLVTTNALLEWTYERRRDAQMILPYLYLGPMTAAKDEAFLIGEKEVPGQISPGKFTLVLGIRQKHSFESKLMTGALKKARDLGIDSNTVDVANNQDLIHSFPFTSAMINNHLARVWEETGQLGRVLLFCESGNERSAGVVAAYLMETHVDVDFIKAMQLVQAQRFCVNFDDAMKRLLQGYWDILKARREVAAANAMPSPGPDANTVKIKRGHDYDDDDKMGGVDDDEERFGGRSFAPFSDQPF
ncbi:Hypothetical protein R9X50_00069000 [Acrodontium crateriforme]|uniref:Protein-tyrosine-phosphatase n=1 Tax=Acrodontium crateriforme TaxID=150365 RepID=A0AAQ3M0Q4_9PEZI|nr:Hypothetical protein R9X50_00069000 [Acrodontium crateriforme]